MAFFGCKVTKKREKCKIKACFLLHSFIFFLSPERKPKQKKECENVLSSEAVCPILVATQWTRFAQTAFRISFLVLHSKPRLNMAPKIGQPLKTSSCGVFRGFSRENTKHRAVIGLPLGLSKNVFDICCAIINAPAESDKRDL